MGLVKTRRLAAFVFCPLDKGQKTGDKGFRTLDFEAAGRRFSQGKPI